MVSFSFNATRRRAPFKTFSGVVLDMTFVAASVVAVCLMGFSKGGFSGLSVLSTPLLALVVAPAQAAAIMLPILIMQDAVTIFAYRRDWDGRILAALLPGSMLGIGLGYLFSAHIDVGAVRLAVGIIALVFAGRGLLLSRRQLGAAKRGSAAAGAFWGAVAGFTSFVSHAGSPPFQVYVLPQRLAPQIYAGTNTLFFAVTNLVKLVPYFLLGQFGAQNLSISAALAPVAVLSALAGVRLVRLVPADRFYKIILWLTLIVGLKLIWDGGRALAGA